MLVIRFSKPLKTVGLPKKFCLSKFIWVTFNIIPIQVKLAALYVSLHLFVFRQNRALWTSFEAVIFKANGSWTFFQFVRCVFYGTYIRAQRPLTFFNHFWKTRVHTLWILTLFIKKFLMKSWFRFFILMNICFLLMVFAFSYIQIEFFRLRDGLTLDFKLPLSSSFTLVF